MPLDKEKVKKAVADLAALTKEVEEESKESKKEEAALKDLSQSLAEIDDED
jgi:hypothetical protein